MAERENNRQSRADARPGVRAERARTGWSPRSYMLLALAAALVTVVLKAGAYAVTGSVGLLSDALESIINVVAALVAVGALTVAARPPDAEHAYGHSKAEYASSALEATLILVAAGTIGVAAWGRLFDPQPLQEVGLGLAISLAATALNGSVALVLWRAGRRLRSITLRADAQHLLTDVGTSLGVVVGVALVQLTGWLVFDPLIALLVAATIVWTGLRLLRETGDGVLDAALPQSDRAAIAAVLARHARGGVTFHAMRTRVAGQRGFVALHVLVPGGWSVRRGHDLCERVSADISQAVPRAIVDTHLEPLDDPASWADQELGRGAVSVGAPTAREGAV